MTAESKGPGMQDGAAAPGEKRKGFLDRLRPYVIGVTAMVVVFGGAALVGAHVRSTKGDKVTAPSGVVGAAAAPSEPSGAGETPEPKATSAGPKLAVPVHPQVPVTITIYEDLRSPDSRAFAEEYQAVLRQLLTTGQAQLHYRLVTAADASYGGTGSKVAANAAACAQDQGRFTQFVQEVWNNQPAPSSDALSSLDLMKKLARKAGKIKMGTFEPCLEQGDHDGWVRQSQDDYAAAHLGAVPVVQINASPLTNVRTTLTPQKLRTMVLAEARHVIAGLATPPVAPALLG